MFRIFDTKDKYVAFCDYLVGLSTNKESVTALGYTIAVVISYTCFLVAWHHSELVRLMSLIGVWYLVSILGNGKKVWMCINKRNGSASITLDVTFMTDVLAASYER